MTESTFQRSLAAGELAPALTARADTIKYVTGLRTCRNWMVLRQGGVANRPGTRHVNRAKTTGTTTFLLRYVSAIAGDSVLLEAGPNYLRVYKNGALVHLTGVVAYDGGAAYVIGDIAASGGVNYYCRVAHTAHAPPNGTYWYAMPTDILEIPTPFGNEGFNWNQSGNVITLTSATGVVAPWELVYTSLTHWAIQPVTTKPAIGPPTALVITPGPAGTLAYQYVVTAAAVESYEESIGSAIAQVTVIGVPTEAAPHVLNWTAPAGGPAAVEYYVYKDPYGNGTFGFIGTATGLTSFRDIGFTPDFAVTPPLPRVLFAATGDYPQRAAYYQQRRFFAHTLNNPDAIWGSRVGFASNFNIASPLQDDDAITFRIAGNQHNPVRHLLGLKTLIVLTDGGEWTVGRPLEALTPSNLPADEETYTGVSDAPAVIVGNSILYVQARGSIIRDLRFDQAVEGLAGRDLTIFASHLFDGYTIGRLDYQQTPHSILWACRDDGTLLGLTYIREQEIWGWHRHDSGASCRFEDVCVVPEPGEDAVYVLTRRTIGGAFVRSIERLESRTILDFVADSFFVDAGLSYSGPPVTSISGLGHLEGQIVAVVADGVVIFDGDPTSVNAHNFTVAGGAILHTLTTPASVIHAGLPIRFADVETLDLDVAGNGVAGQGTAPVRDKKKRVASVSVLLEASVRTFRAGPDPTHLRQVTLKPSETGQAGQPFTGQEEIALTSEFDDYGRVFLRHTDPLPITILGILPNVDLGG